MLRGTSMTKEDLYDIIGGIFLVIMWSFIIIMMFALWIKKPLREKASKESFLRTPHKDLFGVTMNAFNIGKKSMPVLKII